MSITVTWRETSARHHLATPGNHRALCGADVLNALVANAVHADEACLLCMDHAYRYGIEVPATIGTRKRDTDTLSLRFGA